MPQQGDKSSTPEVKQENEQQQIPLPQKIFHILATVTITDNTAFSATITIHNPTTQFNQPFQHAKSTRTTTKHSGALPHWGVERWNDRNNTTLQNSPSLPQSLLYQIGQVQAQSHHEKTERDENISTEVLFPLALLLPNQRFIHTDKARHSTDSEMDQHPMEAEAEVIDKIRKDLVQLGVKLQEYARQQIRFIDEAE
jgi:hypothetical protein